MKQGFYLFASIFQAIVGLAAIAAYALLATSGEPMGKWTVTLILAIAFFVMGAAGILNRICKKK